MENRNCVSTDKGVEVDWMGFWYQVHNRTTSKYSFSEIEDVFEAMCNGTCTIGSADRPSWSKFSNAASDAFPAGAKRDHFINNGNIYGVNH
jgi:hypothetical protein